MGKSGPLRTVIKSPIEASGRSITIFTAAAASPRLCGGSLQAIATAIPAAPLTSKFGSRPGNTVGSLSDSSKLGVKSTVFLSMSASISSQIALSRASV